MILLDTNVLSALMQRQPDRAVMAWLNEQPAERIWITSITVFETRYGIAVLADSQRKTELTQRFEALLQMELENRIAPFDPRAAARAAPLAA